MIRFPFLRILGLITLLLAALPLAASAAGLKAQVNTDEVAMGDSFQLTLTTNDLRAPPPDLSPLNKDFDILATSRASQTSIVNGKRSDTMSWIVSLAPRHKGALRLPPISAGQQTSAALTVHAVDASALSASPVSGVSVTVSAPKTALYVQEEIPITVRIKAGEPLQQAALIEPQSDDFVMTQTGKDENSQLSQGGRPVSVIERHYMLRAKKSGHLTLPAFKLQGTVQEATSRSPFGSAFGGNDPFAGFFGGAPFGGMFAQGKPIEVRSNTLQLDVEAAPADAQNQWFLPAKKVTLTAEWEPANPTFKVGEAVERHIRIVALGAAPEQLPTITVPPTNGVRIYPERNDTGSVDTDNGTAALRETVVSVVPTKGGDITLPALSLKWWDVTKKATRTATIPAQTIHVSGAAPAPVNATPPVTVQHPAATQPAPAKASLGHDELPAFEIIAAALIAVSLLLLLALYVARRRPTASAKAQPGPNAKARQNAALQTLRDACKSGDAHGIYRALESWLHTAGLGNVEAVYPALKAEIDQLETHLYAPEPGTNFDSSELLKQVEAAARNAGAHTSSVALQSALPPLYPKQSTARLIR
ncbi:BatD family protein [Aquicoccus sp. G2-2]|uniref:BatD family protein n=1 Tax=Aquicoccus sp. G2-2 TaxID=3092120 RepID=UPI002AE028BA|nr:BatD family protein [Aquicoccus sp. G2-2]MEA1114853.1 BatD family protein [Aquicoccus sp. G2-2]